MFGLKRWRRLETNALEKMIYTLKLMSDHGIPGYGEKYTKTLNLEGLPCYLAALQTERLAIFCKCTREQWQFLNEVGLGNFTYKY